VIFSPRVLKENIEPEEKSKNRACLMSIENRFTQRTQKQQAYTANEDTVSFTVHYSSFSCCFVVFVKVRLDFFFLRSS
jgi:hypothetical protein